MRNILNIDYLNNDCWGTFNTNSNENTLKLKIRVSSSDEIDEVITLNIITSNNETKNIQIKPEYGLVTYDVPFEDWKTKGNYSIKKADADSYIIINIPEKLNSSDKVSFRLNKSTMGFEAIKYRPIDPAVSKVYPIGTVYESTNGNFDPNSEWGGQWVKIEGKFLLGSSSAYPLGGTGGSATHTLTESQLPIISKNISTSTYDHGHGMKYTDLKPTGTTGTTIHAMTTNGKNTSSTGIMTTNSHYHSLTVKFGGGSAHNNMPPYIVVNIWERTA